MNSVAGIGPQDLQSIAEEFLDASIASLDTIPDFAPGLGGAPVRSFVSPGTPALDCCLVSGTLVSMEYGTVPIEDIRVGQNAWAYESGQLVLRPVMRVIPKGKQNVLRLNAWRRRIIGTPDHRMLVAKSAHAKLKPFQSQEWVAEWVEMQNLERGDYLVTASNLNVDSPMPGSWIISEDMAWLLGAWVGDGCFSGDYNARWFMFNGHREELIQRIARIWSGSRPKEYASRVDLNSKEAVAQLSEFLPRGSRAHTKRVPEVMWHQSPSVIGAYLDGYAAADGHAEYTGYTAYSSASVLLAKETRMLHINLGHAVSNINEYHRRPDIRFRGQLVKEMHPIYTFRVYPDSPKKQSMVLDYRGARRLLQDSRLSVSPVKSIKDAGVEMTYDLEVEGAHNFIADGIVVHNCDQLSVHVNSIGETQISPGGLSAGRRAVSGRLQLVQLIATSTRCVPIISEKAWPTPEEMEASAAQINADAWALWNHIYNLIADGQLFQLCGEVFWDGLNVLTPSGGCGGIVLSLRVRLDGYQEVIST